MAKRFAETFLGGELRNACVVSSLELSRWVFLETVDVGFHSDHALSALELRLGEQLVDLVHLAAIPNDLLHCVVAACFEEDAVLEHVGVLLDQRVGLDLGQVKHLVLELAALLFEDLQRVLLSP